MKQYDLGNPKYSPNFPDFYLFYISLYLLSTVSHPLSSRLNLSFSIHLIMKVFSHHYQSIQPTPHTLQNSIPSPIIKSKTFPQRRQTWTDQENVLYARFLKLYTKKFSVNDGDKKFRKYKRMSLFMVSKTPKQCRTHHQKMMIKYETVETIIWNFSAQRNQQKENEKTGKFEQKKQEMDKSQIKMGSQGIGTSNGSQGNEKSIPSYSSELIFDILF